MNYKVNSLVLTLLLISCFCHGKNYHVAPDSKNGGTGTINNPWNISYAMNQSFKVKPGDTILLHAGTYKGNYDIKLQGQIENPITIMPYKNETAIIDAIDADDHHAALHIQGNNLIIQGLRITNSTQRKTTQSPGSFPNNFPTTKGIYVEGNNIKIINNIVDNSIGTGIGASSRALNTEIYGNIIFHFGWQGPDRGHGHGIYLKNQEGIKTVQNNIIFNGFQYTIQIYGKASQIKGFHLEGNISFGDGKLQIGGKAEGGMILGGRTPLNNVTLIGNYLYQDRNTEPCLQLGYAPTTKNRFIKLSNNVFHGGYYTIEIKDFSSIVFENNTIIAGYRNINITGSNDLNGYTWENNRYYNPHNETSFHYNGTSCNFAKWIKKTELDKSSSFKQGLPANITRLIPNKYDPNRSHLVVFNFQKHNRTTVDLSAVLKKGMPFEIYDVENLFGSPVTSGIYTGTPVSIPLNSINISKPLAPVPSFPKHTSSEFGAFLIKIIDNKNSESFKAKK